MTVGVASANSILMVTFAKEQMAEGFDSVASAQNAGSQRFRPVLMTATAMIIGMIPNGHRRWRGRLAKRTDRSSRNRRSGCSDILDFILRAHNVLHLQAQKKI